MMLWRMLCEHGWAEMIPLKLLLFAQVGLPENTTDRQVWRFVQINRIILLTGNRRMADEEALELTIREENTLTSLPVLTIANVKQMTQRSYRERCEIRMVEIISDIDNYLGTGRIFIP